MPFSLYSAVCILLVLSVSTSAHLTPVPRPAGICSRCGSNADCVTNFCVLGVCLARDARDISQCLGRQPTPIGTIVPVPGRNQSGLAPCARCSDVSECASGLQCSGRPPVCHDGRRGSLRACRGGRRPRNCPRCPAVPPAVVPVAPVRPEPRLLPDCAPCLAPGDCASDYCSFGLCGPPQISVRCLLPECRQCDRDSQCVTGKCWSETCTFGTVESLVRCGYTPPCGPCTSDDMCSTLNCYRGVCVAGRNSAGLVC